MSCHPESPIPLALPLYSTYPRVTSRAGQQSLGGDTTKGRSCSHRTVEGGIKAPGRKEMGRGPVLTEHVLGARNVTHIILFNPHRSPVR